MFEDSIIFPALLFHTEQVNNDHTISYYSNVINVQRRLAPIIVMKLHYYVRIKPAPRGLLPTKSLAHRYSGKVARATHPHPPQRPLRQPLAIDLWGGLPLGVKGPAYSWGGDCRGFRRFQKAAELTALYATFLKSEPIIIVAVLTSIAHITTNSLISFPQNTDEWSQRERHTARLSAVGGPRCNDDWLSRIMERT
ncbi:hypothetical protein N7510_001122 [Penicillium lagena]|uniref:uncharacterized protein n=1 Tax=Penicillium lagena TaxID=94218 RepID=UPI00254102E5|nr:uncharacterized protein N7510_001122 [Penicillium lagena]KAJ5624813.1 hypothetical protein N7510_001122 [Penicillium lagena]